MEPFRDELAASHAKIAELERQVRTLDAEVERLKLPSTRHAQQSNQRVIFVLVAIALAFVGVFIAGVGYFFVRSPTPAQRETTSPPPTPCTTSTPADRSGF